MKKTELTKKILAKNQTAEKISDISQVQIDYEMLINKEHGITKDFVEEVIKPKLVEVEFERNNSINFKVFGIKDNKIYLEERTAKAFNALRNFCSENNIKIDISSGWLSLEQQAKKYAAYLKRDGFEVTSKSICLPGYSEHNSGLALDCDIFKSGRWTGIAPDAKGNLNLETKWLHSVLDRFGFILRYPEGKENITKMKAESWHIRYIGEQTAKYIYDCGLTLEEYHEQNKVD